MKHCASLLVVLSVAVLVASCASTRTLEPGQVDYSAVGGTLTAVEAAPFNTVARATLDAMQALQLKPMERDRDGFQVSILGEMVFGSLSQTHEVRVWVTRLTDATTQLEMRIVGRRDEGRLTALHSEIRKRLGS